MASRRVISISFSAALLLATGCVGPIACGPAGCDVRGPLAFNSCDGCGACEGCGEMYIDPWINYPPDACDPCDRCGNYNGQSCGKCRSVFTGIRSLWGYRCEPAGGCTPCGGCETGCDACGGIVEVGCGVEPGCGIIEPGCGIEDCTGCDACGGGYSEPTCGYVEPGCGIEDCSGCASCGSGSFVPTETVIPAEPTPAPEIIYDDTAATLSPPKNARPIFRSRTRVAGKPSHSRKH